MGAGGQGRAGAAQGRWRAAATAVLALGATVAAAPGLAQQAGAPVLAAQRSVAFDIAAQPLNAALLAFAEQAGVQLVYDVATVDGLSSQSLRGAYTAEAGLARLLAGTGMTFRFSDPNTVSLAKPGAQAGDDSTLQLSPITVEGRTESAYGPVQGYNASRSATATKLDVPILDTPASIQVVPREVIDDQKATRLADVLRNVASVQASGTVGNRSENFLVRGFSSGRLATDGLLAPSTFGEVGFVDLSNVERVEVLKGPASVLYGAADPGGLINIVTKRPQTGAFYEVGGTYGSYDFYRGEVDFNTPLTEDRTLLARLTASYQDADSFRDLFRDSERFQIAPSLRWMPTERTTVDVQVEYFEQEQQFDRGLVAVNGDPLALPTERYLGEPEDVAQSDELRGQAILSHRISDDWSAQLKLRATDANANPLDTNTFTGGLQADGRTATRFRVVIDQDFQTYAADANLNGRVETGPLAHQLVFGVDTHLTRFDSSGFGTTAAPIDIFNPTYGGAIGPQPPASTQERNVNIHGLYVQDLVSIGERWKVLLGGRYDIAETEFLRNAVSVTDKADHEFSPRLGVVYQPIPDLSLYASYAESFIPTLTGQTVGGADFEPEMGEQFEVGAKREWLDGRLSTTAAAFQLTRENVSTGDPANPGFSIQVGEQRSRGVELEVAGTLRPGWHVIASATYLDGEITEDNTFPEGNGLVNVPEWSGSLWTTYAFQGASLRGLEVGAGVFAVGERDGDLANSFTVPGYARVDLLARYGLTENASLTLNVHNLFDATYVEAVSSAASIEPGPPLTAFATISLRF